MWAIFCPRRSYVDEAKKGAEMNVSPGFILGGDEDVIGH